MKKKELLLIFEALQDRVIAMDEKVETLLLPGENDTIIDGLVERIIDLETIVNAMAKAAKTPAPSPELPKQWGDLKSISGWYFSGECGLEPISNAFPTSDAKDVFSLETEAVSALAMAQLSQLMKVYRGGWVPKNKEERFSIFPNEDGVLTIYPSIFLYYLSFPTKELATQFMNNFRSLINQYFMIE